MGEPENRSSKTPVRLASGSEAAAGATVCVAKTSFEAGLVAEGWEIVHRRCIPGHPAQYVPLDDLPLAPTVRSYARQFKEGLYRHQHMALDFFLNGKDVCLTTGTASGKSIPFYMATLHLMAAEPLATTLAVYPMKALGRDQEARWRQALSAAGLPDGVGRVDGDIHTAERESLLRRCHVILATPDVLHAWMLGNLGSPALRAFLSRLRMLVVDEAHVYTGVFGTHAAYFFRRLQHAARYLAPGRPLRVMAASATLADPQAHLFSLTGRTFQVIGHEDDTSPRHELEVVLLRPPAGQDLNSAIATLLAGLAQDESGRFLAFVDSRKQTELLTAILSRRGDKAYDKIDDRAGDRAETDSPASRVSPVQPSVLPYRAGYEEEDRRDIEQKLSSGQVRGVVSTSALELGLDIAGLTTGVLLGVPATATSFYQRMGRIGRSGPGKVYVVHAGSPTDDLVFSDPQVLFQRPCTPSSLYLENRRIQYIHALCFGAADGEYDTLEKGPRQQWTQGVGGPRARETAAAVEECPECPGDGILKSDVSWPEGFLELCQRERAGNIPRDLVPLKVDAAGDPWHTFPLRDADRQFRVELRAGDLEPLGSLSFSQVMREAYPGAVYYYMGRPYRVTHVSVHSRRITVKPEKHYFTEPLTRPALVYPTLGEDGIRALRRFGDLTLTDCELMISESVFGYKERQGSISESHSYPCSFWQRDRFVRNYVTTGVLITHATLALPQAQLDALARLVLEGFLLAVPFERTDIAVSSHRHHAAVAWFQKDDRSIVVFDRTYGSLRLSSELMEPATLRTALKEAGAILDRSVSSGLGTGAEWLGGEAACNGLAVDAGSFAEVLAQLIRCAEQAAVDVPVASVTGSSAGAGRKALTVKTTEFGAVESGSGASGGTDEKPVVICPGGHGWIITDSNTEFRVERVFFHPKYGLCYRGHKVGELPELQGDCESIFPVANVQPVPGLCSLGTYDYDTGEVIPRGDY